MTSEFPVTLPTVGVIIPAKNEAGNIFRCIDSIRRTSYPQELIRIVVVDNGSTDDTARIAESFGASVLSRSQGTIASLRNAGAAEVDCTILAFLDADMEVSSHWLSTAVAALDEDGVGAVGGLNAVPENTTWVDRTWFKHVSLRPDNGPVSWLGSGNLIIRKITFDAIGGWNSALETCEDLDLCDRLRSDFRIMHLKNASAIHHGGFRSLREMFHKELWRGKNSLSRWKAISRDGRQAQSILLPMIHGICIIGFAAAIPFGVVPALIGLAAANALPALRTSYTILRLRDIRPAGQFFAVWHTYYLARALSPFAKRPAPARKQIYLTNEQAAPEHPVRRQDS